MELEAWTCAIENISKKLRELENSDDIETFEKLANKYLSLLGAALPLLKINECGKIDAKFIEVTKEALCLNKRVDEFEEKHLKYNIPNLGEYDQSFKNYLENLQEFMKIWKKEAEKGRGKGEKSLIEWLQQLDQSRHEERKMTLEGMKKVAIDLGTDISYLITDFLFLVVTSGDRKHIMKNLDDFKAMLKILSVEKDSIVIKNFLSVIQLVKRTMKKNRLMDRAKNDVPAISDIELELIRMILKEVLRLEVALCCPDLPMVLTDEVYLSMGCHLRNFFEKKFSDVVLKMNEMRVATTASLSAQNHRDEKKVKSVMETITVGIQSIWNKLDLYSC